MEDSGQVQIQRIVQSKAFKTSEVHRNLLTYLGEKSLAGTAQNLKEYTIGLDVFGKPATYDPRQESVVRMHVGRLRQKLAEYYRTEGKDDPIVVDLPKGGFTLTFETRPTVEPAAQAPPSPTPILTRREVVLLSALLIAVAAAAYFGVRYLRAPSAASANGTWTADLQQLWAPLLTSDRPLMVTLATDPFHVSPTAGSSGVTGVGTANAAFLLGQFLGQRKHNVFPIPSDVLSMGEIAMGDVIFVGPTQGSPQIRAIPPVEQPFVLRPEGVRNLMPAAGEPELLADVVPKEKDPKDPRDGKDQEPEISYALISFLPGLYGNGEILYLSGNRVATVMGAVQALTDPDLAHMLVSHLRKPDGSIPRFYQLVLKVKAMNDTPVDISYMFHRELVVTKPSAAAKH